MIMSTFRHSILRLCVLSLNLMVIVVLMKILHISYIQTPSTAICTSTQPEGDCCPSARSSTVSYIQKITDMCISSVFHSVWWWLLSYRKILHCLLHSDAFYWYVYFHSVWWWLVSYRKILHRLLHSDTFYGYVCFHSVWWWLMSYRKILHCRLHSDAFYCHLYFHSAWWWLLFYIQTPSCYLYFH